jgi:phosphoglycerol transferase
VQSASRQGIGETVVRYAGALVLCLAVMTWALQLWGADLTIPFGPQHDDNAFYGMLAKSLTERGWYLHNEYLSAPAGLDLHDFPIADNLQILVMKLIALWTKDYGVVLNVYYLLTFPLTAMTSLFAFQRLGFSYPTSVAGSLLFTFLPYHFFRGEMHIFLSGYYLLPLVIFVILWIAGAGDPAPTGPTVEERKPDWRFAEGGSRIVCVLVASAGLYYAFFSGFLLLVAGAYAWFRRRQYRSLINGAVLCSIIMIVSVCNILPNILYIAQHGLNASPVQRPPISAEYYGLKIPVMLLPVTGHRVPALAQLKATYSTQTVAVNENDSATLGIVGALGFLLLVGRSLFGTPRWLQQHTSFLAALAALNLSALLLALTNGFSGLVAYVVPIIRGYNRISLYIGFFAFLAVGAALDTIGRQWPLGKPRPRAALGIIAAVLGIGLLDQTTPTFVPHYAQLKAASMVQTRFVRSIEATVPAGTMIFQLPYAEFPDNRQVQQMWGYEHLQGYLHSHQLRWSYAAMKGRSADGWLERVSKMPPAAMAQTLAFAGFGGIYVDRNGFEDRANGLIGDLTQTLHTRPISSEDGRRVFLDMYAYTSELRKQYTPQAWRGRRDAVLSTLRAAKKD